MNDRRYKVSSEPTDALIYLRISDDTENDEHGVQAHLKQCQRHCERRGWPVHDIYTDNDVSAWSGRPGENRKRKQRPGFEKMLKDAQMLRKVGNARPVLVAKADDRLYRDPGDYDRVAKWSRS